MTSDSLFHKSLLSGTNFCDMELEKPFTWKSLVCDSSQIYFVEHMDGTCCVGHDGSVTWE